MSPRRIAAQVTLFDELIPDDRSTLAMKSSLLDWLTWLIECADLPEHLRERLETDARAVTVELGC